MKSKRIVMLVVTAIIALLLVACGGRDDVPTSPQETATNNPVGVGVVPSEPNPSVTSGGTPSNENIVQGPQPSEILPRLENAYNSQDIYAMLNLFEPAVAESMYAILDLFGLGRTVMRQIVPFLSGTLGASGALDQGQWGTVSLAEISTERDDDSAMLTYSVNITYADGSTASTTDTIRVVLIDGTWYIATFQQTIQNFDWDAFFNPQRPQTWYNLLGYDAVGDFAYGLWPVQQNRYWGFIDEGFEVVIPIMYQHIIKPLYGRHGFNYGVAVVLVNGANGILDTDGNFFTPLNRDFFNRHYARMNDSQVIINENFIVLGSHMFTHEGVILHDNFREVFAHNNYGLVVGTQAVPGIVGWGPSLVVDFEGNILSEIGAAGRFGITRRMPNIESDRFSDNWLLVLQYQRYLNAVNLQGGLLFDEWKEWSSTRHWRHKNSCRDSFDLLAVYSVSQDRTFLFDANGEVVWSEEGEWEHWQGGVMINVRGGQIYRLRDSEISNFGRIRIISNAVAIVMDENQIFYGLFVNDDLYFPLEFTMVQQTLITGIFNMNRGPEQISIQATNYGVEIINP